MPTTPSGVRGLLLPCAEALPVPKAGDRSVWSAQALDTPTIRGLRERAAAERDKPWPIPMARGFARYVRDGDRAEYEEVVFTREHRLTRAAVMAAVTLDPIWIDEVADGVVLVCEQSTWCLPAHDDCFERGAAVTDVTRPFLDLRAGDVAAQLAWIDHLLGEQLDERTPGIRERIRHEVDRRVLTPFATRRDWHWLRDVHNWSAWIHGNVLVAGLVLVQDEQARANLVELVAEGLERYTASIPADGAIDEGFMYWWQGACRALEALDLLHHATGGALGAVTAGPLREVVAFPHRMHLGGDWYLNFADGAARLPAGELPWCALHQAARRVGDVEAQAHAAAHRRDTAPVAREEQGLGRLSRALTDQEWVKAARAESPLPREVWLPSTQVMLARGEAGAARGLTLAVKGGHNGEHHNHNDVGGVVVALGGVPVLVDPGRPTYTAQTFGPDRYEIWTMQSSWHNVPEIRASAQAAGAQYKAREVTPYLGDDEPGLALDIAAAYPRGDIVSWRRDARLDRRARNIRVTDAWNLLPAGDGTDGTDGTHSTRALTRVHLMIAGTVEIGEGSALIHAIDGAGSVRLTWEPAHAQCTATVRTLDDPWLRDVWGEQLTRLEVDVSSLGPIGTLVWTLEECQVQGE
ncbi:heparinase II/III family protein [Actinospica durhamensis]|uniref:Heparinase II/III family protein n=1 Tax=Actinospica durhamensis TaxID=1508375 RepID=A0A941ETV2_9ACTN|nr:heparinase II/III family protein [Actinospica durhamensis]MBR7836931.1 heparinase II/III family protein [Actinospica durhamensis]